MKAIELQLLTGKWATFFLNDNFTISERQKESGMKDGAPHWINYCVLDDGNHGNGGWELADEYDDVKNRLLHLFNKDFDYDYR